MIFNFMPAQLGPGYRSPQYHLQEERRVGFCRFQKPEGQLYIVYNSIVLCFFSLKTLDFAQIIISLQNINLLPMSCVQKCSEPKNWEKMFDRKVPLKKFSNLGLDLVNLSFQHW